ncbi:polycomb group protein EMBRYONIC FLOWER 2-like [Impatiens glandulifera]|uniref:polycomb group protein EMBRYONIC FLOWER 2-like n=1 Tax=Impatiens glandulifera TaxID=253017 RepID=UPI001FB10221|nr:polycomb group protein EMBRYONIC FLOWER 2-like [Impatiens glandulifera]
MPGIPLEDRETMNSICNVSEDQICSQDSRPHLSEEEEIAAQGAVSIYCPHLEFYNILQRRAKETNPSFLQRCMRYKIQAKSKSRIQMSVSVTGTLMNGVHSQNLLPICIMLARPVADFGASENFSAVYHFKRPFILTNSIGTEGMKHTQAKFTLPDINKLEGKIKSGSLCILFVSLANIEGHCLFARVPLEELYLSWEKSPNLTLGESVEMMSTIEMHSSFMKLNCTGEDKKYISFQNPCNAGPVPAPQQVEIIICAEEVGAKDKSPYDSYTYDNIPSTSLSHIKRLRSGNVLFNYMYCDNKLQRTEVTEDFCCPFCLVRCASFKGLKYHLPSFHDRFNFEFLVTDDAQAVNLSVKKGFCPLQVDDLWQSTFFFCSKPLRRRKATYVVMDSNTAAAVNEVCNKADGIIEPSDHDIPSPDATGMSTAMAHSHSYADPEGIQSKAGSNLGPPAMAHSKSKKSSIERSDPRNRALLQKLQKRQFVHSQRAQPMAQEEVLSDHDSEGEVDGDVADIEDRRRLDEFVDVTKDEKQMMHMWNSFVRKQRVLADGHIPWACEAFSKLHGQNLVKAPPLLWCWRLFMIKLWKHGLLDGRGMNNCNLIIEQFQKQDRDPMKNKD